MVEITLRNCIEKLNKLTGKLELSNTVSGFHRATFNKIKEEIKEVLEMN